MATKEKIKPGKIEYSYVFQATHRFARLSPFKARYIMDAIRFKPVNEALTLLKFTNRRSAVLIDKVLRSAIANAIDFGERKSVTIPVESLIVKTAIGNEGPRLKRWRARSKGMANPIIKRGSHLFIEVGLPKKDAEEVEAGEELSDKIKGTGEELDKVKEKLEETSVEETAEESVEETSDETVEENAETEEKKEEKPKAKKPAAKKKTEDKSDKPKTTKKKATAKKSETKNKEEK